jgi:hypothetical protein
MKELLGIDLVVERDDPIAIDPEREHTIERELRYPGWRDGSRPDSDERPR